MPRTAIITLALAALSLSFLGPAQAGPRDLDALRRTSLALVNRDRKDHGLPPLRFDNTLDRIAQAHAKDMLTEGYFAHVSPNGSTPMHRFLSAGGSREAVLRENIFHCRGCRQPANARSVAALERGWMHSPGHRANILARGITRYGFGLAEDISNGRYAVQDFSGPGLSQGGRTAQASAIAPQRVTPFAVAIVNAMRKGSKIVAAPALAEAAEASIPTADFASVSLSSIDPLSHLPAGVALGQYRVLLGACGGCGRQVTDGDVRAFIDRWGKSARNRRILTDPSSTVLGMAVAADGKGGKIAVAILAEE